MEAIYNSETKTIIAANARCGSQHLRRISRQLLYKQFHFFDYRFTKSVKTQDYKLVHVVRDPYYRWRSWFYSFYWDYPDDGPHPKDWTIEDARAWLKKFNVGRHYNTHTGSQQILFDISFKEKNFKSHEYIMMNDLDYYLGLADHTRTNYDGHYVKEDQMQNEVIKYFKEEITRLYQDDYDWLKSLQIWNNGVDTIQRLC